MCQSGSPWIPAIQLLPAQHCVPLLSEPHSHMKGHASNKAKMLWWKLIFLAVGEPHNHKPILPDTLLCLCLSSHRRVGITSTMAWGSSSYVHHPTSRVLSAGGRSRWKGSPEHVASACSVSSGASGVIHSAALCLVVGLSVVQGWSTVGCCCATVSLRNFVFSGGQTGWKSNSVCPVISHFGTDRCIGIQHLTVFR